ncbi:hemolysin family protein [Aurantiacibacter gangjinensis]|uniref:Cobalt transporter n=1 Tax=Aurantiacibacter gangjinensis TaxID=502682 RepID=A0A0G9MP58_9SPHN|nr:hemolysin family protein [Aurantiacibacter gangjinensis]APE28261.1 Magnesium and cobalt efflux protein CorC [Aurantiacibacter gangjinensis]KLE32506.1 cobalt transporter [Aurantiacibacter gangjinensis]
MPDTDRPGDPLTGESESRSTSDNGGSGLWTKIRGLFEETPDTSLRAQLEEAIDEHEDVSSNGDASDATGNDLSSTELTMLRNLLHFSEKDADDVAIPRSEIIGISAEMPWDDMVALFADNGHSRMPVYRDQLDDVIGMMHIKDVFAYVAGGKTPPADWTVLMRQPLYVPQARGALDVLADMRARRTHLAIVVDEFSGTDGIITIEDLVEEIVGDIEDEHDEAPQQLIVPIDDGVWDADARAELEDVADIVGAPDLAEVEEAVDTLGGLAFVLAEEVPQPGTVLTHPSGWTIEVTAGDETHVTRLRLHRPAKVDAPEGE